MTLIDLQSKYFFHAQPGELNNTYFIHKVANFSSNVTPIIRHLVSLAKNVKSLPKKGRGKCHRPIIS